MSILGFDPVLVQRLHLPGARLSSTPAVHTFMRLYFRDWAKPGFLRGVYPLSSSDSPTPSQVAEDYRLAVSREYLQWLRP